MSEYENLRTADIVAEALLDWKVDVIFGLPGDGINGFIEALRTRQNKIRFILVRHEESAAFMACAYAKYTGKLGACLATSGPGAIHLLNGLYDAKADNTPVIAITGTTYSDLMNSNYQQDVNLLQLYSDVAVYNDMIGVPEQAEMAVDIACRTALAQRGVSHLTILYRDMSASHNFYTHITRPLDDTYSLVSSCCITHMTNTTESTRMHIRKKFHLAQKAIESPNGNCRQLGEHIQEQNKVT
jgi:thiamine pyrophosphate-dependent acetolactate synthase large subunit-like protein